MMKAIICDGYGGPEVLKVGERPLPQASADEIIIKVEYAGVNRAETLQRKGLYPPPPGATDVLGLECAGRVVLNAESGELGERVIALLSGGGYAQYVKVHKDHTIRIPDNYDYESAAAVTEVWATAFQILHYIACVQKDEYVLVHAGASGVGTALIQLARACGAKTIAVASDDSKLETLRADHIGATHTINYKTCPDFQTEVAKITNGKGCEVIADPVGASNFTKNLQCLALDGRWVLYGTMGGKTVESFEMGQLIAKRGTLFTTTLKTRSAGYKAKLMRDLGEHFFKSGAKFNPIIHCVMPMSQADEAHKLMESNKTTGKILLKCDL